IVADIPVGSLADQAPVYDRPSEQIRSNGRISSIKPQPKVDPGEALQKLLASPNIASKRLIYRQYDCLVQGNTVVEPGSDAAVLRLKGSQRGIAIKVDSNPRACAIDPYVGALATVCE